MYQWKQLGNNHIQFHGLSVEHPWGHLVVRKGGHTGLWGEEGVTIGHLHKNGSS